MGKWTPGPWVVRVGGANNYPYAITAPNVPWDRKGAIRDITRWAAISMPSSAEGQANARLIAEAPAMAEALKAAERHMVAFYRAMSPAGNIGDENAFADSDTVIASIRAILARINGDAP